MAENDRTHRAPRGLNAAGKALWREFTARYTLDEREMTALLLACRQADDIGRLERLLSSEPDMVKGVAGQPVVHPAFAELRQARAALDRLLARIALPDEEGRPMTPAQQRAQKAARARWAGHHYRDGVA